MDVELIKPIKQFSEFETELRKTLSLRKKNGHGYFETPYLFRGQPDEDEIVSTLFRGLIEGPLNKDSIKEIVYQEYSEICNWVRRANHVGLQFNFDIWKYINKNRGVFQEFSIGQKFLESHYPAMSLSRHYGCKNRLIDFTKDGRAALFFSLSSAFKRIEKKFYLLSNEEEGLDREGASKFKKWLKSKSAYTWILKENVRENCDIVFPDYGNNKFAFAQSAVFIIAPMDFDKVGFDSEKFVFSKSLAYYGFSCKGIWAVPYFEVPKMLIDMEKYAINHITYFPSPESISINSDFMDRVKGIYNRILYY